jgi:hypothetical protein
MAPAGVRNRLKCRQGSALRPRGIKVVVAQCITNIVDRGQVAVVVDLEPDDAGCLPDGIGRAVEPRRFTVTARCTDNSGQALQGVGGAQVRIGGGGDCERLAGVAFGLLGLAIA